MLVSISTFRSMLTSKLVGNSTYQVYKQCLINPGPDIVIVDEGHMLKNNETQIYECICQIETGRRVILTGTPLQNNLTEYYVMINFVKSACGTDSSIWNNHSLASGLFNKLICSVSDSSMSAHTHLTMVQSRREWRHVSFSALHSSRLGVL